VVNSIDQDGTHRGYDLVVTKAVADAVRVPVIASGGAGTAAHAAAAFRAGAAAAIISSLYSPRMERTVGAGVGNARHNSPAETRHY
jgi:imidazole glycerol-phosphate synthase subunit HisF